MKIISSLPIFVLVLLKMKQYIKQSCLIEQYIKQFRSLRTLSLDFDHRILSLHIQLDLNNATNTPADIFVFRQRSSK